MRTLIIMLSLALAAPAWAVDTDPEAAARQFYNAWMNIDRPQMIEAFSRGMGTSSPEIKAIVLEAFQSPELEAIYIKHLVNNFTPDELAALNAMAGSPGFRLWLERMPAFTARLLPDAANYFRANFMELRRRVAEKRGANGGEGHAKH
ncbi:hypothetical protein EDC61_106116 [Sulfuritortus calidifontis]|uniref:DUF2059 domain-containing protein n=1 Tax=Sulfuritortus calidifontis TaxID=1914471 RepID=A0A4R3JVS9_9PROT|nr:hypothetical protein [Sulfuritortus calidifontis]TCS72201.1 hypothetical protein EDC61_106116 [Sulfuritortus calidifontis]